MTYHPDDTIAAIATAYGGAYRGIVRVSGPRAVECIMDCLASAERSELATIERPVVLATSVAVPGVHRPVPCDVYLWPNQRSYTRQAAAELHTLGSPPVVQGLLERICSAGARPAEPGEFTLRAFLAGRLDLTQAEAVLGVIEADNRGQFDAALAQLAGGIARPMTDVRNTLADLLAELEAGLDFVEEDVAFISPELLDHQLAAAQQRVAETIEQLSSRGDASDVPQVALIGPPNIGKSSLFNALTRGGEHHADGALVSDRPGTTRDYLVARVELGGLVCRLIDTAGVDEHVGRVEPVDPIETISQQMTGAACSQAAIHLRCIDATRIQSDALRAILPSSVRSSTTDWSLKRPVQSSEAQRSVPSTVSKGSPPRTILVLTKADAVAEEDLTDLRKAAVLSAGLAVDDSTDVVITSSCTGRGLDELREAIRTAVESCDTNHSVVGTAVRCRESLRRASASLRRARYLARTSGGEELIAAELRAALTELGKVVGAVYTDDILDRIFSRFCIGK